VGERTTLPRSFRQLSAIECVLEAS
jgi:hypothetical protein